MTLSDTITAAVMAALVLAALPLQGESAVARRRLFSGSGPAWNGLKVTFGVNPFNSMNFATLPRTATEAARAGWRADSTVTCGGSSPFAGNRFTLNGESSAMLLFDKNGYIAGIQSGIPKSLSNGYPAPNRFGVFVEEPTQWTVTAYFVDPSIVCSSGRSAQEFAAQGTGTMLIIQNGSDAATNRIVIPLNEQQMASTIWTKGKCFYMMGMHYWYDLRVDMPAEDFFPAFMMYNQGRLNSFGWAFGANLGGNRFEHPPKSAYNSFMQTPPNFLMNLPHPVSTMHVYMTDSPRTNFC